MSDKVYNLLFLCTGNSARSIMAECALNRRGEGRFKAYSAGSHPKGEVHPAALQLLRQLNYPTHDLRSESWDAFSGPDAPELDIVVTVCDNAAGEVCPIWLGQPVTVHWGLEDPAAFDGSDDERLTKFKEIHDRLDRRIQDLVNLPFASLDRSSLQDRLKQIHDSV